MKKFLTSFIAIFCILTGLITFYLSMAYSPRSGSYILDTLIKNYSMLAIISSSLVFFGIIVSFKRTKNFQFIFIYWTITILLVVCNCIRLNNVHRGHILMEQERISDYCRNPVKGYECFKNKSL